jgi:hypothetical protein
MVEVQDPEDLAAEDLEETNLVIKVDNPAQQTLAVAAEETKELVVQVL